MTGRRSLAAGLLALAALLEPSGAAFGAEPRPAGADDLAARESRLAHQLRCVVCQNQTLAESNAPLAADMRQVIREQLRDGRSDDEVVGFFEQRYGAFVRYSPPWRPSTWLLWTGPFLVLAAGLAGLAAALRRRGAFQAVGGGGALDDMEEAGGIEEGQTA
jgi:cytochrome c-type biogenesis protein CcmH